MKRTIAIAVLIPLCLFSEGIRKVDLKLDWHSPPGYSTNGGVYNIRYLAAGSTVADYKTWPILCTVTNSISHILYNVFETQLFNVSLTNIQTGVESTNEIQPVLSQVSFRTNTMYRVLIK